MSGSRRSKRLAAARLLEEATTPCKKNRPAATGDGLNDVAAPNEGLDNGSEGNNEGNQNSNESLHSSSKSKSSNGNDKSVAGSAKDNTMSQKHNLPSPFLALEEEEDEEEEDEEEAWEDKTCVLCGEGPKDKSDADDFDEYLIDSDIEGYACRACTSFCERCSETRRQEDVTWFVDSDSDDGYSACDKCWRHSDGYRRV